jgi:hypothetical protein
MRKVFRWIYSDMWAQLYDVSITTITGHKKAQHDIAEAFDKLEETHLIE